MNQHIKTITCTIGITSTIALLILTSCRDNEDIPLIKSHPTTKASFSLMFLDQSNPEAKVAMYANNLLVGTIEKSYLDEALYDYSRGKWTPKTRGPHAIQLGDSLENRTFTIALAEFEEDFAPDTIRKENIIYETMLEPSSLNTTTALVMSRKEAGAEVEMEKVVFSQDEPAPRPGYFKIRFFNGLSEKISVERRDGKGIDGAQNLNSLSETPFIELPFGVYRLNLRRADGSLIPQVFTTILHGAAGKCYSVFIAKDHTRGERQFIVENKDYGLPEKTYAHFGFVNANAKHPEITILPIDGSSRKGSEIKSYGEFKGTELVPSGTITVKVKIDGKEIVKTQQLAPWVYVMAYLVEKDGQPDLYFQSVALAEPEPVRYDLDYYYTDNIDLTLFTRVFYLNLSQDVDKASFLRLDKGLYNDNVPWSSIPLDDMRSLNLSFGEVRFVQSRDTYTNDFEGLNTNRPYSVFGTGQNDPRRTVIDPLPPLRIQAAYGVEDSPKGVGDPIPNTQLSYPFFNLPPAEPVENYSAIPWGDPGSFSVVLTGSKDPLAPTSQKLRLFVFKHSF